jgi:7,8-dihydropterin-6-yl-methyl-4-(beta-D-ribofuranosyl)aminobenzene 5'-phosphate synthase
LFGFLNKKHKVKVYVPASFSRAYRDEIRAGGAECIGIKDFTRIAKGIYSSGELGEEIKEQSLIVDTDKGLVIVTGCSHPGIVNIVRRSKELLRKDARFVVGGFHLGSLNREEVGKIIEELKGLGVKKTAPCHCTGEKAISIFEEEFKKDFIKVGAGSIIDTAGLN